MTTFMPARCTRPLHVESLNDEILVYDPDGHRAHALSSVAAAVWQHADGRTSISDIAARVADTLKMDVDDATVWQALRELDAAALLDAPLDATVAGSIDADRRRVLARLGWAASIPFVTSILVPTAAFAQSPIGGNGGNGGVGGNTGGNGGNGGTGTIGNGGNGGDGGTGGTGGTGGVGGNGGNGGTGTG
jgi:hypothetical protein